MPGLGEGKKKPGFGTICRGCGKEVCECREEWIDVTWIVFGVIFFIGILKAFI